MSELVRFGVAMDRALLSRFDERIAARGYENRSEALRDLVRADLTRAAWDKGEAVVASLSYVVQRRQRPEAHRLLAEVAWAESVSSMSVPLDEASTLEVVVLRGRAGELSTLAGKVGGMRGVSNAELSIAAVSPRRGAQGAGGPPNPP